MDEYVSTFISECILDDRFVITEYTDYTATVDSCDIEIFRDLKREWKLRFEWNERLEWFADEGDIEVMRGYIRFVALESLCVQTNLEIHDNASEFIKVIIGNCVQTRPNVFRTRELEYNFNTMICSGSSIQARFMMK